MPVVQLEIFLSVRALTVACLLVTWLPFDRAHAQMMNSMGPGAGRGLRDQKKTARDYYRANGPVLNLVNAPPVNAVRVIGNITHSEKKVRSYIQTRVDRAFDPELIQSDVRKLMASGMFHDVRTYHQETPRGVVVTFEVIERPTIRFIKYLGNKKIKDRVLARETGLKEGESLNLYTIEEAAKKIEQFYRTKGHPDVGVDIAEGNQPEDRGVVFLINEGYRQRVWDTNFVGNTFVNARRLKTKIETKPGYFWLIKGQFDRKNLETDVEKLTAYYRSFGFFRAQVGREFSEGPSGKWITVNFVIDEGPQYVVRNVSFIGNTKFENDDLVDRLELLSGASFNLGKLNRDVAQMKEFYGSYGHIFADVKAEPRFLEEPGRLDLVYNINEGEIVRVRDIRVKIAGDNPHTKMSTALVRTDIQPGDIVDIRKIRAWERRLKASQLFENNPALGKSPRVVVKPVEVSEGTTR